jgi:hypothetical protein
MLKRVEDMVVCLIVQMNCGFLCVWILLNPSLVWIVLDVILMWLTDWFICSSKCVTGYLTWFSFIKNAKPDVNKSGIRFHCINNGLSKAAITVAEYDQYLS